MNDSLAAVPTTDTPTPVMEGAGIRIGTLDELARFARMVLQAGLAPKGLRSAEAVLIAMQTGMEAGLTPMRALSSIIVIHGIPTWSGKAALALVRASGKLKGLSRGWGGEGDAYHAWIETARTDQDGSMRTQYSVSDAKRARLWAKAGPWSEYPDRMLYWRAVGFNLVDQFGDILQVLPIAEEVRDYPAQAFPMPPKVEPTLPKADPTTPDPLLVEATNGRHALVEKFTDLLGQLSEQEIEDLGIDRAMNGGDASSLSDARLKKGISLIEHHLQERADD